MKSTKFLYVICHQFSETPWNNYVYDSIEEAYLDAWDDSNKDVLYIVSLSDFLWQVNNKKLSPNVIKVSSLERKDVQSN